MAATFVEQRDAYRSSVKAYRKREDLCGLVSVVTMLALGALLIVFGPGWVESMPWSNLPDGLSLVLGVAFAGALLGAMWQIANVAQRRGVAPVEPVHPAGFADG